MLLFSCGKSECGANVPSFSATLTKANISEMTIGGIPPNDMITTWAGLSDLIVQPTNVFFYFTYPEEIKHLLNEYKALDIQGHFLRFGMTRPPTHTKANIKPQEVFGSQKCRIVFDWCKHLVRTNIQLCENSPTHFFNKGNLIFI